MQCFFENYPKNGYLAVLAILGYFREVFVEIYEFDRISIQITPDSPLPYKRTHGLGTILGKVAVIPIFNKTVLYDAP